MRLGQLARKYNLSQPEIISFLNEVEANDQSLHSNSKLTQETEVLLAKRFNLPLDGKQENLIDPIVNVPVEQEVETEELEPLAFEEKIETPPTEPEEPVETEDKAQLIKKVETIDTDKLLELMESEETAPELDNITLIKVPKKELSGLKVLGKIELAEDQPKADVTDEQPKKEPKAGGENRQVKRLVSDEELEARRLRANEKKKEHEARLEKRRLKKEKKDSKAIKEAYYQQKIQRNKPKQEKLKAKTQDLELEAVVIEQEPKPKTIYGKFMRWLNT